MIKSFEWKIAKKYIGYHNHFISLVSYLATLGIALGVMTLIIVMSVMNGYEVELIKKILGINGHISISSYEHKIGDYNKLIQKVKDIPGVTYAAPLVTGQALAESNGASTGVLVRGMDMDSLNKKPIMHHVFAGAQMTFEKNEILIGRSLAKNLNLNVGDKIRLMIPKLEATVLGVIPRLKTFYVAGVFDVGMYEYNASTVFIPLHTAQILFERGDFVSEVEVIINDPKKIDKIKMDILNTSQDQDLLLTDWGLANQSLIAALKVERTTMFFILVLIIMIAAFNIISGLTMLVKEKYKSIAILRAIGVSRASIIKIFILTGVFLGGLGTLGGVVLGSIFLMNINRIKQILESATGTTLFDPMIYFLTSLPSEPDVGEIISIVAVAVLLSFFATIYPAWKAANMLPAEALRYE
ncbi:lipoprotein-releasing ABC transporter permease subunit [Candidatus Bandiella euplotis]|uniref:Lipoprotein-releasing ABC transporter permease subunit n=1 Tax=Candidatus Bandiella euplotis TaxID=1664265 RepID=A0ABZ0UMU7_9RICK|nr:lipoprotein-releasing ABC transporter permease subunit [Candidatus Bandiella woodruffii]WPX96013.1 Putative lipoprotein-releasing ABC transporter permease subunit [Candidatus Bandiella woodruffii]